MLEEKSVLVVLCCALFLFAAAGISQASDNLPAGFIAVSDSDMTFTEAVAFCKEKGGKLPRINNSNSWDGKNPPEKGVPVEGFGKGYGPWPKDLRRDYYWTGQTAAFENAYHIRSGGGDGFVILGPAQQRNKFRAACVK